MATNLIPFKPTLTSSCASSGHHNKPDRPAGRKSSSASWWTPLFGWSSDPDYIDSNSPSESRNKSSRNPDPRSAVDQRPARSVIARGGFTEEKARQLRQMTLDTASFHDAMYHSSIASRLASDFGTRPDL